MPGRRRPALPRVRRRVRARPCTRVPAACRSTRVRACMRLCFHRITSVFRDVVFRMWGFKILVVNPSPTSALGVKSPHLQLLRVNQLLCSNLTSSNTTSLSSRPELSRRAVSSRTRTPQSTVATLTSNKFKHVFKCEGPNSDPN